MPKISVIIPMFNAENYIESCLKSVLEQTFTDFEVIVVDDASTDKSVSIVEKIAPKFDGRLSLIKREKNSGGIVAIPRNIGVDLACGEYISFLDNDDLLMPTAFEQLCAIADDTQADVLNSSVFFSVKSDEATRELLSFEKCEPVKDVTLLNDDLAQRVEDFIEFRVHLNVWTKLFRRRFLVENEIRFPPLPSSDDMLFSFYCLMRAKRYVRIPHAFYVWRVRTESVSHEKLSPEQHIRKWLTIVLNGTRYLDEFLSTMEFFRQSPFHRFNLMTMFIQDQLNYLRRAYKETPVYIINELMRAEIARHPSDNSVLLSSLITTINLAHFRLKNLQTQNEQLQKQLIELDRRPKARGRR